MNSDAADRIVSSVKPGTYYSTGPKVEFTSPTTMTKSGFILPDMAIKKECIGTVIGIGQSVEEIKIGDVVQYTEHCLPTSMKHDEEEHLLIQEGDVFAILVEVADV